MFVKVYNKDHLTVFSLAVSAEWNPNNTEPPPPKKKGGGERRTKDKNGI